MPRIVEKKPAKPKKAPSDRPPEWADIYSTVGYPDALDKVQEEVETLLNGQACTCGHDRTCHSDLLGRGNRQVMVVDCPKVGRCYVKGCECEGFVFSDVSSWEGKKKREKEQKVASVVPPSEGEV